MDCSNFISNFKYTTLDTQNTLEGGEQLFHANGREFILEEGEDWEVFEEKYYNAIYPPQEEIEEQEVIIFHGQCCHLKCNERLHAFTCICPRFNCLCFCKSYQRNQYKKMLHAIMFNDIPDARQQFFEMPDILGAKALGQSIERSTQNITNTIDSQFSVILKSLSSFLETCTEGLKKINEGFSYSTLVGIVATLYACWRSRHQIDVVLAILLPKLTDFGLTHLLDCLSSMFTLGKAPDATQQGGNGNLIHTIGSWLPTLTSILVILLGPRLTNGKFTLNPRDLMNFYSSINVKDFIQLGHAARSCTNIQAVYSDLTTMISGAYSRVVEFVTGEPFSKHTVLEEKVKRMAEELQDLNTFANQCNALVDTSFINRTQKLLDELIDLEKDTRGVEFPNKDLFRDILSMTRALHARLLDVSSTAGKSRTPPLAINLVGNSGIGKSFLTDFIIKQLAIHHNKLVADKKIVGREYNIHDTTSLKYTFNRQDEYYSGYANQFAINMDDFGQVVDTSSTPCRDYGEIIALVNDADYPLASAHLFEKGKLRMQSQFIICTSNLLRQSIKSIHFEPALYRRFKFYVEVRLKKQYQDAAGNLDKTKVNGVMLDIYDVVLINPVSLATKTNTKASTFSKTISMPEFLSILMAAYTQQYENANAKKDFVNDINNYIYTPDENLLKDYDSFVANDKVVLPKVTQQLNTGDDTDIDDDEFVDALDEPSALREVIAHPVSTVRNMYKNPREYFEWVYEGYDKLFSLSPKESIREYLNIINERCHQITKTDIFSYLKNGFNIFLSTATSLFYNHGFKIIMAAIPLACFLLWKKLDFSSAGEEECACAKKKKKVEHLIAYTQVNSAKCNLCANVQHLKDKLTYTELVERAKEIYGITSIVKQEVKLDANACDIVNRIGKNMYKIISDDGAYAHATFVTGRALLVNKHVLVAFMNKTVTLKRDKLSFQFKITSDMMKSPSGNELDTDYAILLAPDSIPTHANIKKYFVTSDELSHFTQLEYAELVTTHKNEQDSMRTLAGEVWAEDKNVRLNGELKILRDGYHYRMPTTDGTCGSLLVAHNPKLQRKIIGMHEIGIASLGTNWSMSITQNKLNDLLSGVPAEYQISLHEHSWEIDDTTLKHNGEELIVMNEGTLHSPLPPRNRNTALSHSPLYDKIEGCPPKCAPAVLYDPEDDPLTKGLKKVANLPPPMDADLLNRCADHYFSKPSLYLEKPQIYDYTTSIVGCRDEGLEPIHRDTSPGYPWIMQKKTTLAGKKEWFGEGDKYIINEEVKAVVDKRIDLARQGIRMECLWNDTLKDERRPLEKVMQNKTRVFSVGPQDYMLAVRMYFGRFAGHIMQTRIENEVCVGINATSEEWTILARKLLRKGTNIVAGDFSNYDGSLLIDVLRKICSKINEWYDDGEENALIRTTLFEEICNGYHLCGDHVYQWTHSQPSGNPLTVIINSIFNSIIMRAAWVIATKRSLVDFDEHVCLENYGDDNILSISNSVINEYNQLTITSALATLGLTYTDEAKTGELVPYRSLSEVSFLKRGFRQEGALYHAPLSLSTITEMPQWLRSTADPPGDTAVTTSVALMELSLHDTAVYEKYSQLIRKACMKTGVKITCYPIYDARLKLLEVSKREDDKWLSEEISTSDFAEATQQIAAGPRPECFIPDRPSVDEPIQEPESDQDPGFIASEIVRSMPARFQAQPPKTSDQHTEIVARSREEGRLDSEPTMVRTTELGPVGALGGSPIQSDSVDKIHLAVTSDQEEKLGGRTMKISEQYNNLKKLDPEAKLYKLKNDRLRLVTTLAGVESMTRDEFRNLDLDAYTGKPPGTLASMSTTVVGFAHSFCPSFCWSYLARVAARLLPPHAQQIMASYKGPDYIKILVALTSFYSNDETIWYAIACYISIFDIITEDVLIDDAFRPILAVLETMLDPNGLHPEALKLRLNIHLFQPLMRIFFKYKGYTGYHTLLKAASIVMHFKNNVTVWFNEIKFRHHNPHTDYTGEHIDNQLRASAKGETYLVETPRVYNFTPDDLDTEEFHAITVASTATHMSGDPKSRMVTVKREVSANISGDPKSRMVTVRREIGEPDVIDSLSFLRSVLAGFLGTANSLALNSIDKNIQNTHMNIFFKSLIPALTEELTIPSSTRPFFGLAEFWRNFKKDFTLENFAKSIPAFSLHFISTILPLHYRIPIHFLFNLAARYGELFHPATIEGDVSLEDVSVLTGDQNGGDNLTSMVQETESSADTSIDTAPNVITPVGSDLEQHLQRWVNIGRFKMSEGDEVASTVFSADLPTALFTNFIKARLRGAHLLNTDIEFMLQINGTRFDIGQLLMMWIPYTNGITPYDALTLPSQTGYESQRVRVGVKETGTLKVRGLVPHRGYELNASNPSIKASYNFGEFRVTVINPLLTGDDIANVSCAVWARMVNPQLSIQAPVLSLAEAVQAVGGTVKAVSSIVSSLGIPKISPIAGTIEKVASIFGFSKPQNVEAVAPRAIMPATDWFHSRGSDNSYVVGYDQKDFSATYLPETELDEMSVPYLMSQLCYHKGARWTRVTEGEITDLRTQVRPLEYYDTFQSDDMRLYDTDFLGLLGGSHILWSGAIDYEIEVLAHMGQSGRIRIGVFPPRTDMSKISFHDFDNVPNEVIDLSDNISTVKISIPNLSREDWLGCSSASAILAFWVVNPLRANTGTPQDAWINIWRKGNTTDSNSTRFSWLSRTHDPQLRDPVAGEDVPDATQQIYCSEQFKPVILANNKERVNASVVDETKSVKEAISIASYVGEFSLSAGQGVRTASYIFGNDDHCTMTTLMSSIYRFYRGSKRISAVSDEDLSCGYDRTANSFDYYQTKTTPFQPNSAHMAINPSVVNKMTSFLCPYVDQTPFMTRMWQGSQDPSFIIGENSTAQSTWFNRIVPLSGKATTIKLFESMGDDFQFIKLIGVPRLTGVGNNTISASRRSHLAPKGETAL